MRDRLNAPSIGRSVGFLFGMGLTSVSLSSGFIWASEGRARRVFLAAFLAWGGYLLAHYAATGRFIDAGEVAEEPVEGAIPESNWRRAGVVVGASVLVLGMVVGVVYIRAGNHLYTNVGGFFFLGGYVVAHYAETDYPL